MTTDQKTPEDPDLERWLAKLGGKGEHDDALADRLRSTVLKQQQQFEDEFDELRLRRGRDQLIAKTGTENSAGARNRRARPFAIAASVFLAATASLIGYQQLTTPPGTSEVELIMYYGDLERPRGGFSTTLIAARNAEATGRQFGRILTDEMIPFELIRHTEGSVHLTMFLDDSAARDMLSDMLQPFGASLSDSEFQVIVIESSD